MTRIECNYLTQETTFYKYIKKKNFSSLFTYTYSFKIWVPLNEWKDLNIPSKSGQLSVPSCRNKNFKSIYFKSTNK